MLSVEESRLMEDGGLVNGARVAAHVGVTRSAVTNWVRRGNLPPELRPLDNGPHVAPLWPQSQLPEIKAWYESRPRAQGKRKVRGERQRDLLLEYVRAAKKAAAVRGHQGFEPDDHYWMGKAAAYQDIENLLAKKRSS